MSRKVKAIGGIAVAGVIIAVIFLVRSTPGVTFKCNPKLLERPDDSFELVDVRVKRQSMVGFYANGSFRRRMLIYGDQVLAALHVKKGKYQISGTINVISITYRAKNLSPSSLAYPTIYDQSGKMVVIQAFDPQFDPKTGTGVLRMLLPETATNLSGWKVEFFIEQGPEGVVIPRVAMFSL